MVEYQFLTFLVERLDVKVSEMSGVELQAVAKPTQEMKVYVDQLRSVINQVYADEVDETQRTDTQRTTRRRSTRRGTADGQQNTAD